MEMVVAEAVDVVWEKMVQVEEVIIVVGCVEGEVVLVEVEVRTFTVGVRGGRW